MDVLNANKSVGNQNQVTIIVIRKLVIRCVEQEDDEEHLDKKGKFISARLFLLHHFYLFYYLTFFKLSYLLLFISI